MNLSVGIVGLPNVGKSTLFNALLKRQATLAANYPFATIEPNVGVVPVPDERLNRLAEITAEELNPSTPSTLLKTGSLRVSPPPIIPAVVQFVDIAGLVKGASEGEGLGNKFLSHIREAKIIAHVVRAFEDTNVVREGSTDVKSDYETIRTELILADLQTLRSSKVQGNNQNELIEEVEESLDKGKSFDISGLSKEEKAFINSLNLLSLKPEIIVLNINEKEYAREKLEQIILQYSSVLECDREEVVVISANIESELASLSEDEQKDYLFSLGFEKSGLERLIQKAYKKLGLISFLTTGPKETRAWTIKAGSTAAEAAGEIHTDFVKKFIKAEAVSFDDFISSNGPASPRSRSSTRGGWKKARESGKARLEGKDYIVQDGDIIDFKIGA